MVCGHARCVADVKMVMHFAPAISAASTLHTWLAFEGMVRTASTEIGECIPPTSSKVSVFT